MKDRREILLAIFSMNTRELFHIAIRRPFVPFIVMATVFGLHLIVKLEWYHTS